MDVHGVLNSLRLRHPAETPAPDASRWAIPWRASARATARRRGQFGMTHHDLLPGHALRPRNVPGTLILCSSSDIPGVRSDHVNAKAPRLRRPRGPRVPLPLLLSLLMTIVRCPAAQAEVLPTKGTFRGIYSVNQAGVARFRFFIIPKAMKPRLAPYVGRYIELEVVKASQRINPGPAIVEKIGAVRALAPPPIRVDIRTVAPGSAGAGSFDIVYTLKNLARHPIELNGRGDVGAYISGPLRPHEAGEPDLLYRTGYTREQLSAPYIAQPSRSFMAPLAPGEPNHSYAHRVRLLPGESVPFVWHSLKLPPGEYEIVVNVTHRPAPRANPAEGIPARVTAPLRVPLIDPTRRTPSPLRLLAKVTRQEEWLRFDVRLVNTADEPRHVFVRQAPHGLVSLPALLQFTDAAGKLVPVTLGAQSPRGPWVRRRVDSDGLRFQFRARQRNFFSTAPIARIELWTVTEAGLDKLLLADRVPPGPPVDLPPWGKTLNGCACRIRLAKRQFGRREPIRLFLQAKSDGSHADIFWMDEGKFRSRLRVLVDGKPVRVAGSQVSDGHVHDFPFQGELTLVREHGAAAGVHLLQIQMTGDPGTYVNLRGEKLRKFRGTLVSNEVELEIAE